MDTSFLISVSALAVSVLALILSVKSGIFKSNSSLNEKHNSFRINVFESSMEVLFLIEKMRQNMDSEQKVQIFETLVDTASGMASMYTDLRDYRGYPWYLTLRRFARHYDHMLTEWNEFNRVLSYAKTLFSEGKFDKLEKAVNGLHFRVYGSNGSKQESSQVEVKE